MEMTLPERIRALSEKEFDSTSDNGQYLMITREDLASFGYQCALLALEAAKGGK